MLLAGLISVAASLAAQAQDYQVNPIASDNFTGDGNGSLNGATGGTGWTSPWTLGAASSGVNWTANSSAGQISGSAYNLYDNYRSLPQQSSGIVYVEVLANYSDNSGNGYGEIRLGLNSGGGFPSANTSTELSSGGTGGGYFNTGTWGIIVPGASPNSSFSTTELGSQTLLLEQINYTTATTKLWVNPNLSGFNYLDPTATPDATVNGAGEFSDIEFLSVAGTVSDVSVFSVVAAPEPTSYAVAAGALLLVVGMRRRRA